MRTNAVRKRLALGRVLILCLLTACTGVPDGVDTVSGFELDRYLGTWYEIARLDHRFERGLSNVTATYSMRDDGGVQVVNRGFNAADAEWQEAEGKAYFVGAEDEGRLKVSFFGPFYGGYNIVKLDMDDYQYALVVGPDRGYLWILARSPAIEQSIIDRLITTARDLNFPTEDLIFVRHQKVNQ